MKEMYGNRRGNTSFGLKTEKFKLPEVIVSRDHTNGFPFGFIASQSCKKNKIVSMSCMLLLLRILSILAFRPGVFYQSCFGDN